MPNWPAPSRLGSLTGFLVGTGVVVLAGLGGYLYRFATSPLPVAKETILVVPEGASYNAVAARLIAKGLARPEDALALQLLGRYLGITARIRAGEYRVEPHTTPLTLLKALAKGRVASRSVTLPEGWKVARFLERLRETKGLDTAELPYGPRDPALTRFLGLSEKEYPHAEGWLFPDTYRFQRGDRAKALLKRSHRRMRTVLAEEWANRSEGLPLTGSYEALILASIVEKETAMPEERPLIAGVFLNRLRTGMRLQADPTVIYGLGEAFSGNLQESDLASSSPYNTYQKLGLPPTPIANPGRRAIRAVCQPASTEARYFVSQGNGQHVFSETLQEHNRAVRRYQLRAP